ncbi:hypothetical protein DMB65_00235 [Flavobacterium cheongpyeongense]|uniref:TonB-dependent receptor plug domain-containing protein n=1 Tax=Flavobacterium cheongpyeongense TaxID=2212651 RepID=A0A2V4BXB4_9FLAO|nr:TonB-dependent receptor plug domain-containing protein [Flavobacterium cheongpyeongense]PXY42493.1 hypothetical protein DMB65_00235 [Flavobacterium cheongpyeongense]
MKSLKLISLAITMLICFVLKAQEKIPIKKPQNLALETEIIPNPLIKMKDTICEVAISSNFVKTNASPNFRIVCAKTISYKAEPLYILDGIPIQAKQLAKINPNDIEEIKVLKGIDATSLYGNQATNGVIVITSKEKE